MKQPVRDSAIALFLFLFVSALYFATVTGVTSSNDGSHYALVRALVERHSFEISPYMAFTEYQDYALRGDLRFSDRPPGTALLAAPLYALGTVAPRPPVDIPSRHDAANPYLVYALLLPPLAGGGAITLFYLTLRQHFARSQYAALLVSLALALGTTTWKYGSVLYSHAQAALTVWLALYLTFRIESRRVPSWPPALLLGFVLGFAPLIEYTSVLFSAIIGFYLLLKLLPSLRSAWSDDEQRSRWLATLISLGIGAAVPIGFLLLYNTLNFGGPFEVSTFNADTELWPQNAGLAADFATPLPVGLQGLLFYGSDNQGIFLLSPVTLIALAGLPAFFRHSRRGFALLMGLFVVYLLLFAKSTTFNPLTNDGRYLTPFIGLLLVPLVFWVDEVYRPARGELRELGLSLLLFGLLFLSIRNQAMHIALSWNYDLDLSRLRPMAIPPENVRYLLGTLFRNAGNLPVLWMVELPALAFGWLAMRWRRMQKERLVTQPLSPSHSRE